MQRRVVSVIRRNLEMKGYERRNVEKGFRSKLWMWTFELGGRTWRLLATNTESKRISQ